MTILHGSDYYNNEEGKARKGVPLTWVSKLTRIAMLMCEGAQARKATSHVA